VHADHHARSFPVLAAERRLHSELAWAETARKRACQAPSGFRQHAGFCRQRYSFPMTLHLQINGSAISDISSFHAEINRVFMSGEDWQLGPSLDALDDLLYGGYGALAGHATATVLWRDIERSRVALGVEATLAWLDAKLQHPGAFNADAIGRQRAALERGDGQTYFEIIMEIFAGHPRIRLVPG